VSEASFPYVQKVAGLSKKDLSQPDWKFLHQEAA
jgi:hypothetical protein